MNHFIGTFRLEELPENANPGDIAQLKLNKDQVYRDGHGNLAVDRDLIILSEDGCWNKYEAKINSDKKYIISFIKGDQIFVSDIIELTNDELNTIQKIANGFKELEVNLISVNEWKYIIHSKEEDSINKYINVIISKYKLH